MFDDLKKKLKDMVAKRRAAREVEPEAFKRIAGEIRDLARLAGRVCPPEDRLQEKIERIMAEMEQLMELAERPDFRHLSREKRLALRESLLQSREQLLDSVNTAPSPTKFLQ